MIKQLIIFQVIVMIWIGQTSLLAEDFGRLFTTPKQRQQLDELRNARQDVVIEIKDEEIALDKENSEKTTQIGTLTVKGLVYRSDGKNTAWINEGNSYEGDLTSEFTGVKEDKIHRNKVNINVIGTDGENLSLKVGQTLNPVTKGVQDITDLQRKPDESPEALD